MQKNKEDSGEVSVGDLEMEGWRDGGMEGWRDGGMEGLSTTLQPSKPSKPSKLSQLQKKHRSLLFKLRYFELTCGF